MRTRLRAGTCWVVTLAAAGAAQPPVILPPAVAATRPATATGFFTDDVFFGSATLPGDAHSQLIYETRDIAPSVAVWNTLAVRRPVDLPVHNVSWTAHTSVLLSVSPRAPGAMTTNYAANLGPASTIVISGPIVLPFLADTRTWPAPWIAIPFTTSFAYASVAGGSLVVDIHHRGSTAPTPWYLETMTVNDGGRFDNGGPQPTCRFGNQTYNDSLSSAPPRLGGTWSHAYYGNLPPGLTGFGVLGQLGHGSSWNGVPLPLDLAPFGAPGCRWSVSLELVVPLIGITAGYRWPTFPIPNDPSLASAMLLEQGVLLDPGANALGVVTTWSSKWILGDNRVATGALVYATGLFASSPTGTLTPNTGVALRLQ
jgi:hypothetical protein